MSALPEGTSIYYIYPEETKLIRPKEGQNLVGAINNQMDFFAVEKNVLPV